MGISVLYVRISSLDGKTDRQRVNEEEFDRVIEDKCSGSIPIFEREGKDLYLETPIPFEISVIGGSIKVPTLEGTLSLKIPSQTQTGKIFRIRGKGAAVVRDPRRGDILCRVIVETPSNLDKKQTKLLKEFTDSLNQSKNYPGTESFIKASSQKQD